MRIVTFSDATCRAGINRIRSNPDWRSQTSLLEFTDALLERLGDGIDVYTAENIVSDHLSELGITDPKWCRNLVRRLRDASDA
jgi:hypothetical protein